MKTVAKAKIFNFRLPFAAALSLACGVGLAYFFALYGIDFLWLIAVVPVAAVIFIAVDLFARSGKSVIFCLITICFLLVGAAYAAAVFSHLSTPARISEGLAYVSGRVEDVRRTSSGGYYLILSLVTADGVPLGGKLIAYLGEQAGGAVVPGYTVGFSGSVAHYDLFSYGALNYRVISGVRYYANINGGMEYTYGFSLFGVIRSGIYGMLFDNLDYETAAVAYAMITGSTQDISEGALNAFRYGGVSHIFAVSGLNITVLYVVVTFVLRRIRLNKWAAAFVALGVVFFYTGLCGFTLSAVRAAIMCAVAAVSSLAFAKYDGLNSLSLSVIIILLINPLSLFDVGFVLSVSAMLGIIFLGPNINYVLRRLPSGVRSNISMSVSSQIATLPALVLTFGYISGAGLILNILILPLLSFLYVLMFACVVACAIIPSAAPVVLPFAALPLQAVINFFVQYGFENSLISGFGGWWVSVIAFALVAVLSDKFNFSRSFRAAAGGVCAVCFALCCMLGGMVFGSETRIVADGSYGGGMVLVRSQSGTTLILICDTYAGSIPSFVNTYAPEGVDDLIITGGDECAAYYYECGVAADNVWLPPSSINLGGLDGAQAHYEQNFTLHGTYYAFNDGYTLSADTNGVTFLVSAGQYINAPSADIAFIALPGAQCAANTCVYLSGSGGDFNAYAQGCLQFILNGGKLILTGLIPAR